MMANLVKNSIIRSILCLPEAVFSPEDLYGQAAPDIRLPGMSLGNSRLQAMLEACSA